MNSSWESLQVQLTCCISLVSLAGTGCCWCCRSWRRRCCGLLLLAIGLGFGLLGWLAGAGRLLGTMFLGVLLATLQRVEEIIVGAEGTNDGANLLGWLRCGCRRACRRCSSLICLISVLTILAARGATLLIVFVLFAGLVVRWRCCCCRCCLRCLADGATQGGDALSWRGGRTTLLLGSDQSVAQCADDEEQAAAGKAEEEFEL